MYLDRVQPLPLPARVQPLPLPVLGQHLGRGLLACPDHTLGLGCWCGGGCLWQGLGLEGARRGEDTYGRAVITAVHHLRYACVKRVSKVCQKRIKRVSKETCKRTKECQKRPINRHVRWSHHGLGTPSSTTVHHFPHVCAQSVG